MFSVKTYELKGIPTFLLFRKPQFHTINNFVSNKAKIKSVKPNLAFRIHIRSD